MLSNQAVLLTKAREYTRSSLVVIPETQPPRLRIDADERRGFIVGPTKDASAGNAWRVGWRSGGCDDEGGINEDALAPGEYGTRTARTAPGTTIARQHPCTN